MKITVDEWQMWTRWVYQKELDKNPMDIRHYAHTTFYPPIERTTLDGMVTLLVSEVKSYKKYLQYVEESKKRIAALKKKHKREANKLKKQYETNHR